MSELPSARDLPAAAGAPRAGPVLLTGGLVGLLVGTFLTNLSTALLELDESRSLGAACEHAEATIAGAPSGLLIGLAAAAVYLLLRRHRRRTRVSVLGGGAGALVALLIVVFLLYPLATNYLPVFVCSY